MNTLLFLAILKFAAFTGPGGPVGIPAPEPCPLVIMDDGQAWHECPDK